MRECYEEEARRAGQESLSYEQYLMGLAEREVEARRQRKVDRFLRESKLPLEKSLESFDRKRMPRKVMHQVNFLLEGSFIDRRENVLVFGNPGSGKTHLVCAVSQELIRERRRIYFTSTSLLVQELLVAKRDLTLSKLIKKFAKYDAVVIDDIGYVEQSREEMEVLFTLLAERYERGSVMITSNLPFSKWERIFKDPMTTAAAIDRLVHHSVIVELNLTSYRMETARKVKSKQGSKGKQQDDKK